MLNTHQTFDYTAILLALCDAGVTSRVECVKSQRFRCEELRGRSLAKRVTPCSLTREQRGSVELVRSWLSPAMTLPSAICFLAKAKFVAIGRKATNNLPPVGHNINKQSRGACFTFGVYRHMLTSASGHWGQEAALSYLSETPLSG
jgi:hypothetical protein